MYVSLIMVKTFNIFGHLCVVKAFVQQVQVIEPATYCKRCLDLGCYNG